MKKIICCVLLIAVLVTNVAAVNNIQSNPSYAVWNETLWLEGEKTTFLNQNQEPADLISHNSSVYMPLQNAAQWLEKQIIWDTQNWTVNLTDGLITNQTSQNFIIPADKIVQVYIDGKESLFVNAQGLATPPIVYNNNLYVPMRAIAELCNMTIVWKSYGNTQSIYIKTPLEETQSAEIKRYYEEGIVCSQTLDDSFRQLWNQLYLPGDAARDMILVGEKLNNIDACLEKLSTMQTYIVGFADRTNEKISQSIKYLSTQVVNIKLLLDDNQNHTFSQTQLQPNVDLEVGTLSGYFYSIKDAFEEKGYIG